MSQNILLTNKFCNNQNKITKFSNKKLKKTKVCGTKDRHSNESFAHSCGGAINQQTESKHIYPHSYIYSRKDADSHIRCKFII